MCSHRASPSLLIIVVADSTLSIVSTLFPADQMSDDFFPLDILLHRLNEIVFISHRVLCLNRPERRVRTIHGFSLR